MPLRRVPFLTAVVAAIYVSRRRRERQVAERIAAAALEALLNAVDANDRQTGAHVRRVAAYALVLARAAGLDQHQRRAVERAALFHDIGKIHAALFDLVHDEDRLSPRERRLVATHPERGAAVLRPLAAFYPDLGDAVLAHHERWDGSGYPFGLRGEEIPIAARVVAIADTFDAITHRRRYRRERSLAVARRIIAHGRGTQFDPAFVDLFLAQGTFAHLRRAFQEMHAPRIRRRSRPVSARDVPDITFRWRSESLEPLPLDRERRTPLG